MGVLNEKVAFCFVSVQHLRALLAARDDAVAECALKCLMLLTVPPLLHRHQQVSPPMPGVACIYVCRVDIYSCMVLE